MQQMIEMKDILMYFVIVKRNDNKLFSLLLLIIVFFKFLYRLLTFLLGLLVHCSLFVYLMLLVNNKHNR